MVPMSAQMRKGALHEPCSSGRESAHSSLGKFEPTHVGRFEPVQVHGPNAFEKTKGLSMNLVAADVSPLIFHWGSLSRLTSAATSRSGSWSQCIRKNERGLSMNLVAADVSPLILHWGSFSRLTSAATSRSRFMVPMHSEKRKG